MTANREERAPSLTSGRLSRRKTPEREFVFLHADGERHAVEGRYHDFEAGQPVRTLCGQTALRDAPTLDFPPTCHRCFEISVGRRDAACATPTEQADVRKVR